METTINPWTTTQADAEQTRTQRERERRDPQSWKRREFGCRREAAANASKKSGRIAQLRRESRRIVNGNIDPEGEEE